jgi:preprotein translocase subunit YajC
MNFFLAAETAPPPGGGAVGVFLQLLPVLIFFLAFYYLFVAAPMKKKQKAFQQLMAGLKSGDRVTTTSGIYGVVTGISEKTVKLRVANNVVVEMDKSSITGMASEEKEEKK